MKDTTGEWCFNLKDGRVENNNRIIIHPCNEHRDQRWKVIHRDYGNFDAAKYKTHKDNGTLPL
jgi:hypothetical protein